MIGETRREGGWGGRGDCWDIWVPIHSFYWHNHILCIECDICTINYNSDNSWYLIFISCCTACHSNNHFLLRFFFSLEIYSTFFFPFLLFKHEINLNLSICWFSVASEKFNVDLHSKNKRKRKKKKKIGEKINKKGNKKNRKKILKKRLLWAISFQLMLVSFSLAFDWLIDKWHGCEQDGKMRRYSGKANLGCWQMRHRSLGVSNPCECVSECDFSIDAPYLVVMQH